MTAGRVLTPRQKAAIIVRVLLAEGEDISLEGLPVEAEASGTARQRAAAAPRPRIVRGLFVMVFSLGFDGAHLPTPVGVGVPQGGGATV